MASGPPATAGASGPPATAGRGAPWRIWEFLWENRYWIVLTGSVVAYLIYVLKQNKEMEAEIIELSDQMKTCTEKCDIQATHIKKYAEEIVRQAEILKKVTKYASAMDALAKNMIVLRLADRQRLSELQTKLETALSEKIKLETALDDIKSLVARSTTD